jgi:hypothetical protein
MKVCVPPVPEAPVRLGPLALRIAMEEGETSADSEMVEDDTTVGGLEKLEILVVFVLVRVLDRGTELLGGAAALMLRVLL